MPTFTYQAFDAEGRRQTGTLQASSSGEATRLLGLRSLRVESIVETRGAPAQSDSDGKNDEPVSLGANELRAISTEVANLAKAQLPLSSGLAVLADELPAGRLRRGMHGFARKLERGMGLEEVYASYGAPTELRAIVRSGIRIGRVDDALAEYVAHRRNRSTARLRVFLALGYPLAMFAFALSIIAFFLLYLVPAFKRTLMDFDTELPVPTRLLLELSDFMTSVGWKFFVGMLVAVCLSLVVLWFFLRSGKWHSFVRRIPVIGTIWHWSGMSRFCHLLAVLIDNRLPLPEAIVLAGDSVGDFGIRRACRELSSRITTGDSFDPEARSLQGFPSSLIEVVTEYKQTEALPEALHAIGDMFENRTKLQSNFVAAICGPVILMFSGFILGLMVVAMFMPLIKLLNDLT